MATTKTQASIGKVEYFMITLILTKEGYSYQLKIPSCDPDNEYIEEIIKILPVVKEFIERIHLNLEQYSHEQRGSIKLTENYMFDVNEATAKALLAAMRHIHRAQRQASKKK